MVAVSDSILYFLVLFRRCIIGGSCIRPRLAHKKGDKKGSGMLAIVFGRGTNLDIVAAQDTLPPASISANQMDLLS